MEDTSGRSIRDNTEDKPNDQSEAGEIKEQARKSWTPGENLLTPSSS